MIFYSPIKAADIIAEILSQETGFDPFEILGTKQNASLVTTRHILIGVLRELGYSFPDCAKGSRRTDHTTAINSYKRVQANPDMRVKVLVIAERVRKQVGGEELEINNGSSFS